MIIAHYRGEGFQKPLSWDLVDASHFTSLLCAFSQQGFCQRAFSGEPVRDVFSSIVPCGSHQRQSYLPRYARSVISSQRDEIV